MWAHLLLISKEIVFYSCPLKGVRVGVGRYSPLCLPSPVLGIDRVQCTFIELNSYILKMNEHIR